MCLVPHAPTVRIPIVSLVCITGLRLLSLTYCSYHLSRPLSQAASVYLQLDSFVFPGYLWILLNVDND